MNKIQQFIENYENMFIESLIRKSCIRNNIQFYEYVYKTICSLEHLCMQDKLFPKKISNMKSIVGAQLATYYKHNLTKYSTEVLIEKDIFLMLKCYDNEPLYEHILKYIINNDYLLCKHKELLEYMETLQNTFSLNDIIIRNILKIVLLNYYKSICSSYNIIDHELISSYVFHLKLLWDDNCNEYGVIFLGLQII